jgi:hypothetical protein
MELTRDYLVNLRDHAMAKRQEYLNMVHQANGAIDMLSMLIDRISQPGETPHAPDTDSND